MRINELLLFSLLFIFGSCASDSVEKAPTADCSTDDFVRSKETAQTLIIGKWDWIKTTYIRRGSGTTIETPLSTDKIFTLEFTDKEVRMSENDTLNVRLYEIQFWGEGTNTVDDILVVNFSTLSGELQGRSMLFLNASGTCLTLGNSYNDAGGDSNFKKADSTLHP